MMFVFLGRLAQFVGLAVGLLFLAMFAGTRVALGPISELSAAVIDTGASPDGLVAVAIIGFGMFAIGTGVFAFAGPTPPPMTDTYGHRRRGEGRKE
jgi:hypothetical protein